MRGQGDAANEWRLPIGQMVLSEAFTLEHSISLTENLEKLGSISHQMEAISAILSDDSRTEIERIKHALRAIRNEPPQTSLSQIEEQKAEKLPQMMQYSEEIVGEPTIQIDLASQDDLYSEEERQITNDQNTHPKQEQGYSLKENVTELRSLLLAKEQEVLKMRQQKEEEQAEHHKQVAELERKLQISQDRLGGCSCKPEKAQEVSRMKKWLETLNKLLYGAQKQASASREELKRSGEHSSKQLKEKDERIRSLQSELQSQRASNNNNNQFSQ